MILWFKNEQLLLPKVTPQLQLKRELFTSQHVVLSKLQKFADAIFNHKDKKKKTTMMSFIIGSGSMWEFHSHFLIHPTINSSHTMMLL